MECSCDLLVVGRVEVEVLESFSEEEQVSCLVCERALSWGMGRSSEVSHDLLNHFSASPGCHPQELLECISSRSPENCLDFRNMISDNFWFQNKLTMNLKIDIIINQDKY